MMLKATDNDRRTTSPCPDEFREPLSDVTVDQWARVRDSTEESVTSTPAPLEAHVRAMNKGHQGPKRAHREASFPTGITDGRCLKNSQHYNNVCTTSSSPTCVLNSLQTFTYRFKKSFPSVRRRRKKKWQRSSVPKKVTEFTVTEGACTKNRFSECLRKSATETCEMTKHVYGSDALSRIPFLLHPRHLPKWKNCPIEIQKDIVHLEFIPEGHTVDKDLYVDNLHRLHESIRKKRPKL
ncbi:hypothetical protein TNCV_3285161 [Trichonephila clavipes]|nr:hypothetical protein TNCV_3285161 [Trichonephila clavipes]